MKLALALLAIVSAPAAEVKTDSEAKQVSYELRFVEARNLGWRSAFQDKLKPIAVRDGKSIWTLEESALRTLLGDYVDIKTAPKVTAFEGDRATVRVGDPTKVVESVRAVGSGTATTRRVGFVPKVTSIDGGDTVNVKGRQLDQGMLLEVEWDSRHVVALHNVGQKETDSQGTVVAQYQVPEINADRLSGEWLLPEGSLLVLSMGPQTVAGPLNIAQTRERLLLVYSRHIVTEADERATLDQVNQTGFSAPPVTANEPKPWMPTPPAPSRTLPQAPAADGSLPPLPDDTMHVTPESGESVDPKATPQMRAPTQMPEEADRPVAAAARPQLFKPAHVVQGVCEPPATTPPAAESVVVKTPDGLHTLPSSNLTDVGPDIQEPFHNRSYADIVTKVDEAPTGRVIFGSGGASYGGPTFPLIVSKSNFRPEALLANAPIASDPAISKAGFSGKMGTLVDMNLKFDGEALSKLKTETKVTRIPMPGNLALEITARIVPAPKVACEASAECSETK